MIDSSTLWLKGKHGPEKCFIALEFSVFVLSIRFWQSPARPTSSHSQLFANRQTSRRLQQVLAPLHLYLTVAKYQDSAYKQVRSATYHKEYSGYEFYLGHMDVFRICLVARIRVSKENAQELNIVYGRKVA